MRLHIFGASGTGTSTLARGLATRLSTQCFDTDDFFWVPSNPPFMEQRLVPERLMLMQQMFLPRRDWILSGSLLKWGEPVLARMTDMIFLTLDPEVRMAQLRARELQRYGSKLPVGYADFMRWAEGYDKPTFSGRNLRSHREWIAQSPVRVIELDAGREPLELVEMAVAALDRDAVAS